MCIRDRYCSFQQIDILVTDRRPADEWMELLEEYHIRILYPEEMCIRDRYYQAHERHHTLQRRGHHGYAAF